MAGRLMPSRRRWALLVALVLAGHLLALGWLALHWKTPVSLQPMATPLFTRQLLPTTGVSVPEPARTPVERAYAATKNIANPEPAGAASAAEGTATVTATATQTPVTEAAASDTTAQAVAAAAAASAALASLPTPQTSPQPAASAPPAVVAPMADPMARWPQDTRLSYRLGGNYRGELHGDARVQWQREAERYQVQVSVNLGWLVSAVMTSQGRVLPEGLHPAAYEEKVRGVRRTVELGESQLVMGDGQRLPRPPRVQDTASQFVELTWRFLSGQVALEQGSTVRFWLARPGGADEWIYDVVGQETLQTRLGALPAWHLVPRPLARPRGNITAEMWFAPGLQYLPARIKLNLGTEAHVDLLIDKVEQAEAKTRP